MNEKWVAGEKSYEAMIARHTPLWNFIEYFVKKYNINNIVDVGGGIGYARKFCKEYAIFDKNPKMIELLTKQGVLKAYLGDFLQADISDVKEYDLVLILAVVEHTGTLNLFLKKALEINPRFIIVSFFRGVQEEEQLLEISSSCTLQVYSERNISDIINELSIKKVKLFTIPRREDTIYTKDTVFDDILLIDNTI